MSNGVNKLMVRPITLREANDFVEAFHRHNGRTSRDAGRFAIAAIVNGTIVGVAIVGRPLARLLDDGLTAEVTRTCTNEEAPRGCVSKLYSHCWRAWRAMGGLRMITYTLQDESGASLRGAGWSIKADIAERTAGWESRKDSLHITREWQPIYGQKKFRWEISATVPSLDCKG